MPDVQKIALFLVQIFEVCINIKQENESLVSHSGLLQVGALLESLQLAKRFQNLPVHCVDPAFPHGDILSCMVGLICIGKPDYDAIEFFRKDQVFFSQASGLIYAGIVLL